MTEPSGRLRRSNASDTSSWSSRGRRFLVAGALIAVIVLAAAGLSIALGGGSRGSGASPSQALIATDAPPTTPTTSFPAVVTDSPTTSLSPSPSPSQTAGQEIKAKRILIERLGIDLKIIEGDGVDAPIGKAAHYPGTGWPGGGTNIYLYGHARTGMFLSLWDVKVGDEVVLTLVDGSQRTYLIAKVIAKAPWDALQYLDPTPTEQLTLQTSTSYHPTSPRFIAIAFPAP